MNDVALEKQIKQIAAELRLSGEFTDNRFMELKADVDRLRLEVTALSRFLERTVPSFSRDFPPILEAVFQKVNPEVD
jgi:hypothetical protein